MSLKLNKYDIAAALVITIVAFFLIYNIFMTNRGNNQKIASVYFQNKVVKEFDLSQNKTEKYEIEATNGLVKIETKEGKVRVVSETSQNNICSIQGYSDSTVNPIVCLPNNLYIKITTKQSNDEVDVFIK